MTETTAAEEPSTGTSEGRTGNRAKTTDGGSPTVSTPGDDQKTLINKWGPRAVHVLMVIVPTALVLGLVLQGAGVHSRSMVFAQTFVGAAFIITGVLAVAAVLYDSIKLSRRTEH